VDWAFSIFMECHRVSRGLTAWVVAGRTRDFRWSGTPVLLQADLIRAGVGLRNPPLFKRFGIQGSGGPDWFRSDYETIICATHKRLPWSDNLAMGHPPKFGPGGDNSNRNQQGERIKKTAPSSWGMRNAGTGKNGVIKKRRFYKPPAIANPGNVIDCGAMGGGRMGHPLAHEHPAPFPEKLVEFFVKSCCPPDGVVLDPFMGSGTTLAVSRRLGRSSIGIELNAEYIELAKRRLAI